MPKYNVDLHPVGVITCPNIEAADPREAVAIAMQRAIARKIIEDTRLWDDSLLRVNGAAVSQLDADGEIANVFELSGVETAATLLERENKK